MVAAVLRPRYFAPVGCFMELDSRLTYIGFDGISTMSEEVENPRGTFF